MFGEVAPPPPSWLLAPLSFSWPLFWMDKSLLARLWGRGGMGGRGWGEGGGAVFGAACLGETVEGALGIMLLCQGRTRKGQWGSKHEHEKGVHCGPGGHWPLFPNDIAPNATRARLRAEQHAILRQAELAHDVIACAICATHFGRACLCHWASV